MRRHCPGSTLGRIAIAVILSGLPLVCSDWNPRRAADYLDSRQKEWLGWKTAAAPGGTCISCHTQVTYLLARPALRRALDEKDRTEYETKLTGSLRARVDKKEGKEIFAGFAKEPLASQSMGVEAILAALFLTLEDERAKKLSKEAELAFDRMWSLQIKDGDANGAWQWFDLNLDPWETPDSKFFGATLAAMAVGSAPAEYRKRPDVRERVAAMTAYLERQRQSQPLHNRLMLLWASAKLKDAMPKSARQPLIDEVLGKQEADGGWTIQSLGPWREHPAATPSVGSSSYATALTAVALLKAGVPGSNPKIKSALDWLKSHQDSEGGYWTAQSMNKQYKPDSMMVRFMQDAATAFASLALVEAGQ